MERKTISRSDRDGHIIYLYECEYCKTEFWARKANTKYCSNSCRNLKMVKGREKKDVYLQE